MTLLARLQLLIYIFSHVLLILAKSAKSKNQVKHPWSNTCQFSPVRGASDWNGGGPQFYPLEASFLPAATKLGQGNVFTGICDSVHLGGGGGWCWSGPGGFPIFRVVSIFSGVSNFSGGLQIFWGAPIFRGGLQILAGVSKFSPTPPPRYG